MPELPDVEGFRRLLAAKAAGQRIVRVAVPAPEILRNTSPQRLSRSLAGCRLGQPGRHGKWLCAPAGQRTLLLHFGMDGSLRWLDSAGGGSAEDGSAEDGAGPSPHDRLLLCCERGELRYRTTRKLGGVWLVSGQEELAAVTGPLGPDALGVDLAGLTARLGRRRGAVKPALMDQSVLAGLGNLTVDEILWRARVHPLAPASGLSRPQLRRIHDAMREVLAASVAVGRVPPEAGWLTGARDERAAACPRCGTKLRRSRVGGRGTAWCPRCQRAARSTS